MKKTKLLTSLVALALVAGLGACNGDVTINVGDLDIDLGDSSEDTTSTETSEGEDTTDGGSTTDETPHEHTWTLSGDYDDEGHTLVCDCGETKTEAHTLTYTVIEGAREHTVACECGYSVTEHHEAQSSTNPTCICGETLNTEGLTYKFDEEKEGYIVSKYDASLNATEVYVPAEYTGDEGTYPVVGTASGTNNTAGNSIFGASTTYLEYVSFPSTMTALGDYTLSRCTALTGAYFPESITTFGAGIFYNDTALESVDFLPATLEHIGNYCFNGCSKLTVIDLPEATSYIGDYAFQGCTKLGSVVLGSTIEYLGYAIFGYYNGPSAAVTMFYRGSETEWNNVGFYLNSFSQCTDGFSYSVTVLYSGQWEYVDGVPTAIA